MSDFTILDAMDELFTQWFKKKETWLAWRTFLSALFALPCSEEQRQIYQDCTGRSQFPVVPSTEAWLVCGRRSGKSFVLALIAVYLACFKEWQEYLAPGERGTIVVVAVDRKQSRVIMRFIRALLSVPLLAPLVEADRDSQSHDLVSLTNRIIIEVHVGSYRQIRGYSIVAALLDEMAFWRTDENSYSPDSEVLGAVRPGMATIPGSMLLCASSPYARKGELWNAYSQYWGKDGGGLSR